MKDFLDFVYSFEYREYIGDKIYQYFSPLLKIYSILKKHSTIESKIENRTMVVLSSSIINRIENNYHNRVSIINQNNPHTNIVSELAILNYYSLSILQQQRAIQYE